MAYFDQKIIAKDLNSSWIFQRKIFGITNNAVLLLPEMVECFKNVQAPKMFFDFDKSLS